MLSLLSTEKNIISANLMLAIRHYYTGKCLRQKRLYGLAILAHRHFASIEKIGGKTGVVFFPASGCKCFWFMLGIFIF